MHIRIWIIAILAASICPAGGVLAFPVTYTITGAGSGFIGQTPFTNQQFTFTATADSGNVQMPFPNTRAVNNTSATIQVGATVANALPSSSHAAGTGSSSYYAYAGGPVGGEIDQFPAYVQHPSLEGYFLNAPLGPLSVTTNLSGFGFDTNLGQIFIDSPTNLTFQATVVPEPGVEAIVALGIGFLRRRIR